MRLKTVFISCLLSVVSCWLLAFGLPHFVLAADSSVAPQPPAPHIQPAPPKYFFEKPPQNFQMEVFGGDKNSLSMERSIYAMISSVLGTTFTQTAGILPEVTRLTGASNPGAIGATSGLIAALVTNPPASTPQYLADLGSSLGLAKPAYAQTGTGWDVLNSVMTIWKVFRNLAYLVFVLIFIAVGFMIMFRAKINPQTVISVEAAIPNLIITLIIITFSYAIVSLMIDLIWVSLYLIINIFSTYGLVDKTKTEGILLTKNVFIIGWEDTWSAHSQSIAGNAASAISNITGEAICGQQGGSLCSIVLGPLMSVIISIAVLFSMVKLFFQLLMSYIGLIMSVIFAPFQLLGNAFPGSNALTGWLKGTLANALVFPATAVMFMLAGALTNAPNWTSGSGVGFSNIGATGGGVPLLGLNSVDAIKGLLGLGMIMMIPKVVEMIKAALKVEKGVVSPAGALAPLMGVAGIPGQGLQTAMTLGQMKMYFGGKQQDKYANWNPTNPPPGGTP